MGRRGARSIGWFGVVLLLTACFGPGRPADDELWRASFVKDGVGLLDGQTFLCQVTEAGKSDAEEESMEFRGGRFHSVGCDDYGFTTGAYMAVRSAETTAFQCETTSVKEGRIQWHGTVRGDSIEGAFTWSKAGQRPIEYAFKGTRRR